MADTTSADDVKVESEGTGDSGKSDTKETTTAADGDKSDDGDNADADTADNADDADEDVVPTDDGKEPETRPKSKFGFILDRKNKQIEKLKTNGKGGGKDKTADTDADADDTADDADDDDDLPDEDKKLIDKRVQKGIQDAITPLVTKEQERELSNEITEFVSKDPRFKGYEAKVKRFAMHPSRANVPLKSIFFEVAGDDLFKMGAKKAREIDKEAKENQAGGGTGGDTTGTGKDPMEMTDEEYKAKLAGVMHKPR